MFMHVYKTQSASQYVDLYVYIYCISVEIVYTFSYRERSARLIYS